MDDSRADSDDRAKDATQEAFPVDWVEERFVTRRYELPRGWRHGPRLCLSQAVHRAVDTIANHPDEYLPR